MDQTDPAGSRWRFGEFEADVRTGELRRSGARIHLQDQPFQLLTVLLECPGELVTREQLRQRLWAGHVHVDFDYALNTAVKKIRAALEDDAMAPRYVETIPKRGYRFIARIDPADSNTGSQSESRRMSATPRRLLRWKSWGVLFGVIVALAVIARGLGGRTASSRGR